MMYLLVLFIVFLAGLNARWDVSYRFTWCWILVCWVIAMTVSPILVQRWGPLASLILGVMSVVAVIPVVVFGIRAMIAERRGEIGLGRGFWCDALLAAATGSVIALTVFRHAVTDNHKAADAISVHVVWMCVGVSGLIVAIWMVRLWRWTAAGFGTGVLALTFYSAVVFPQIVVTQAQAFAGTGSYEIVAPYGRGALTDWRQRTLLTAPKSVIAPHFVLSFETDVGTCSAAWSYRAMTFRTDNNVVDSRHCPDR